MTFWAVRPPDGREQSLASLQEDFPVVGPDAEQRGVLVGGVTRELVADVAVESGVAVPGAHLHQHAADRRALGHSHVVDGPLELGPVVVGVQHGDVHLDRPGPRRVAAVDRVQRQLRSTGTAARFQQQQRECLGISSRVVLLY